jgi:hypothetical protein
MTSGFLKGLETQWKSLTLKKFVICCIILIFFIMFVKIIYKKHVLESFTNSRTIDDLALVKYEFVKYDDDLRNTDGNTASGETIEKRVVWDNRIYMLQPAKAGERRYSFWNINNDTSFEFDSNTRPIKSIGTGINSSSNEAPPTKSVPVVTAGKFKPIEKYEKIIEIGSDEFSDLHLNYNTIRDTSLEKLLKVQTNIKKRLAALNKLKDYYTTTTQPNNTFIKKQIDIFIEQIFNQYKVTPIGFNNPQGKIGWDTFNLASVDKTNGVRSRTDLTKGGIGEVIAFEGIPFGTILTLSKTAALVDPVIFREPYDTNNTYKTKLLNSIRGPLDEPNTESKTKTSADRCPTLKEVLSVRRDDRKNVFGISGCPTSSNANIYDVFDFTTIRPTNWSTKSSSYIKTAIYQHPVDTTSKQFYLWLNKYSKNLQVDQLYTKLYSPLEENTFTTQDKMYASFLGRRADSRSGHVKGVYGDGGGPTAHLTLNDSDNSVTSVYSTDINNILTPESFYYNMISGNMIYHSIETKTYTSGIAGSKRDVDEKRVVVGPKIAGYDTTNRFNQSLKNKLLSTTNPKLLHNVAVNIMNDTGHLKEKKIRDMNTYKNKGDANKSNLKLSHISFKHFKTKPDEKVKIFDSDVYRQLGKTNYDTLMETGQEVNDVNDINTYLVGDSKYDFNTAFTNFSSTTLEGVVAKELHYTQFNYNLQISMSGDSRVPKVNSWAFDLNGLNQKISDHLESVVEQFRTYYFTSPESPLQNEINVRLASVNKNITMLSKFDSLVTKIQSNLVPFPSLKVIRPIAPKGFKVLGDIVLSSSKGILQRQTPHTTDQEARDSETITDASTILATTPQITIARYQSDHRDDVVHEKDYINFQLQKYVAVPETCVKTVREWRDTDKIFEINESGKTLQIYNNPYTNTIKVTTNKQKPSGNVEKMIACVKECDVVSELKKTDECAKKLYKTKQSLEGGSSVSPNLANVEENKYYLNKIQSRSEHIKNLTGSARNLQIQQDKYEIINTENNRSKLQRYVDDQGRNIAILKDKLEKGKSTIDLNTYIHPDGGKTDNDMQIGSRQETVNMINKLIGQSSLPVDTKKNLITKVETYKRQMDNQLISPDEYKDRVNNALMACPEYNLDGLVHKDTVSNVCYGCNL